MTKLHLYLKNPLFFLDLFGRTKNWKNLGNNSKNEPKTQKKLRKITKTHSLLSAMAGPIGWAMDSSPDPLILPGDPVSLISWLELEPV